MLDYDATLDTLNIGCDECGIEEVFHGSFMESKADAQHNGWFYVKDPQLNSWFTYCKKCKTLLKRQNNY